MNRFTFILSVALVVAATGSVRAGIYCSLDGLPYPVPTAFKPVWIKVGELRAVVNMDAKAKDNVFQKKYLERMQELQAKEQRGELTLDERIDLSGIYLRLPLSEGKAVDLLKSADQTDYLVLAHLAAAYFGLGALDKAVDFQEKALAAWPEVSLRWSAEQLNWYRRAERCFLELLRLRQQDVRKGITLGENVDLLFPRLHFETPDGRYDVGGQPGKRAERLVDDAPADARQLVAQLVWWLPMDNRVYWLYGELLNYCGDIQGAHKVFEELGGFSTRSLNKLMTFRKHSKEFDQGWLVWKNRYKIGFLVAPRTLQTVPCAADLDEVGLLAALSIGESLDDEKKSAALLAGQLPTVTQPIEPLPISPPASVSWLPDWRTVVVSFAAGMVFMSLLWLQWQQWSRRRAAAHEARRELTG